MSQTSDVFTERDRVINTVNEYDSGDCFSISIYKSKKLKLGEGVTLVFYISLKDGKSIQRLHRALGGCGQILEKKNGIFTFRVQDFQSINEIIIPFFNTRVVYNPEDKACLLAPLKGRKLLAFERLKKVANLIESRGKGKSTMTIEILNEIKSIQRSMAQKASNDELSNCNFSQN